MLHVDAGVDAQAIKQVKHVLGGNVAGGALGVRAAAQAGDRAVEYGNAFQQAGVDIGQGLAVGVVEVPGELFARDVTTDHLEQAASLPGGASADGVAQRDFVAAHGEQLAGHRSDLLGCDFALIGAAKHAGDIAAHADAVGLGRVHYWDEALQTLGDGAVDVALGESLGGRGEHCHFLHPSLDGSLEALEVGRQRAIHHARLTLDAGEHLGAAGHLWHPLGRDEAAHLDVDQAGGA